MAAENNYFHPWQSSPKIGSSLKIVWEMSAEFIRLLCNSPKLEP